MVTPTRYGAISWTRERGEMEAAMEAVQVAGDALLGFSPMFATPTGATTKKLVDGTIDPDK